MEQLSWVASNEPAIHAANGAILAIVYGIDGSGYATDVSTATAFSTVGTQVSADYVSGSGCANILPYMGLSTITLPIYAVIDLETAELLYYQDGYGTGPQGSLSAIQGANE
jgi:hypothetical protein